MRLKNGAIPGFILVFSLLFAATITTSAQEMKEAVDLYNFAAQNFKTESAKALEQLKQCEALCEKIEGEEVGDLKSKVQKLYPMIYFEVAKVEYRGKHYAEAVAAMEDAKRTAEVVDDRTTIKNVDKVLPGIYYRNRATLTTRRRCRSTSRCSMSIRTTCLPTWLWLFAKIRSVSKMLC